MKPFLKTKDYSVSGEEFQLLYNKDLDMLVTAPEPKDLSSYYESDVYISHTDSNRSLVDKIYQAVKKYSLRKKVRLITSFKSSQKTVLDIGAGTGDFLVQAKRSGWAITGIEPNPNAREKARQKGIDLKNDLKTVSETKFDVITLWHVLEHLPNLEQQIEQITMLLKKDGVLLIAVPNYKSYDAKKYGRFWAAYDVPRHLWHFSRTSIQHLFVKHKMLLINTKPMLFDSFYVSLLSEKYKSGKENYYKAFYTGLISNIKAWRNNEYSSHIYILKKA